MLSALEVNCTAKILFRLDKKRQIQEERAFQIQIMILEQRGSMFQDHRLLARRKGQDHRLFEKILFLET